MDHPENVLDTSSYNNQREGRFNGDYDQDLYEYNTSKGLKDKVCDYVSEKFNTQSDVNTPRRKLFVSKAFYFFFFAAFGSLFPLMAIYFKQMAMSPTQVGFLFGFRPFVEFLSVPFWAQYAEKWRRGKTILLFSISCWILFTLVVGFIQPPVHSCLMHNGSHIIFEKKSISFSNLKKETSGVKHLSKRQFNYQEISMFNQPYTDLILNRKRRQQKTKSDITSSASIVYSALIRSDEDDELEFNLKTTKSIQNIVNLSFEKTKSNLTSEILMDSKKIDQHKNETKKIVDKTVEKTINNFVKNIVETSTSITSRKPAIATTTSYFDIKNNQFFSLIDFGLLGRRPSQNQNYFDSSPLDSSRIKGKIIYLNDTALKLIKPSLKTSIVYQKQDVDRIFLVFLFFILVGEFFSAPAITMADTCTLQYLGSEQADLYGKQRMFGSLGWGLAMFSIGFLLDNAHKFTDHPCGMAGPDERNYTVCFTIYSILMAIAFIVATQFQFNYGDDEQIPLKSLSAKIKSTVNQVRGSKYQQFDRKILVNEPDDEQPVNEIPTNHQSQVEEYANQNEVFANQETSIQKYQRLFRLCCTVKYIVFLFMIWFMGIGVGLVFTFLFWHLQDLGGSPFLYGIASVANHLSELIAYFFVHDIVARYGHVKIFYAGLAGNTIRFVYVSLITEPYWILPFEFIQGITHALVWAAATSYFAQSVPKDLRGNAQGLLQGLHFGLGRGCGAVLGGIIISSFGARLTFFLYGMSCLVTFILTVGVSQFNMDIGSNFNDSYNLNKMDLNLKTPEDSVVNVVNPLMNDTNHYYQSSSSNQDPNKTPVKLFVSPHGVPSR